MRSTGVYLAPYRDLWASLLVFFLFEKKRVIGFITPYYTGLEWESLLRRDSTGIHYPFIHRAWFNSVTHYSTGLYWVTFFPTSPDSTGSHNYFIKWLYRTLTCYLLLLAFWVRRSGASLHPCARVLVSYSHTSFISQLNITLSPISPARRRWRGPRD